MSASNWDDDERNVRTHLKPQTQYSPTRDDTEYFKQTAKVTQDPIHWDEVEYVEYTYENLPFPMFGLSEDREDPYNLFKQHHEHDEDLEDQDKYSNVVKADVDYEQAPEVIVNPAGKGQFMYT